MQGGYHRRFRGQTRPVARAGLSILTWPIGGSDWLSQRLPEQWTGQ